jgi:hypothetical protein
MLSPLYKGDVQQRFGSDKCTIHGDSWWRAFYLKHVE